MDRYARRAGRLVAALTVATIAIQGLLTTPTLSARLDISPLTEVEAAHALDRATVEVLVLGCDLALRQGTAFALGDGRLVTNQHVVGRFRSIDVSEDGYRPVPSRGADVPASADVALLDAPGLALTPLRLAPDDPKPGDPVRFAGYPHEDGSPSLPDGLVVEPARVVDYAATGPGPAAVMRLDARARPGMSGGPVLDRAGRVAGLVFAVQSPTDDTLAVPASALRRLFAGPFSPASGC